MQLKTYTGISNKDCMEQIKADLGSEAVILETKTRQVNGRTLVSMAAALERAAPAAPGLAGERAVGHGREPFAQASGQWMLHEWTDLKRHILALMKPALDLEALDSSQRAALEFLEQDGVGSQALLELYRSLASRPGRPVLEPLTEMLPLKPWGLEGWPQRLHLVAGPFGAGKTTVAVRLALALQKARPGLRICIINADAERGNGRLLLRHYAGLSDLLYREAGNGLEMSGVLAEISSQGVDKIIVDLPGLPQGMQLSGTVNELGLAGLEASQAALHLVLAPHYDSAAMASLLLRYRLELPSSLIWSKLDEAGRFGSIVNASTDSKLPISSFSFGPGLLNTLLPAARIMLWKILFKHELPSFGRGQIGEVI